MKYDWNQYAENTKYKKQKIKVPLALERPNASFVFTSVKNNFKAQN
jgi:hypothetical protein